MVVETKGVKKRERKRELERENWSEIWRKNWREVVGKAKGARETEVKWD